MRKRRRKEEEEQGLFSSIPFLAEKDFSISSCGKTEMKEKNVGFINVTRFGPHSLSNGGNSLIRGEI